MTKLVKTPCALLLFGTLLASCSYEPTRVGRKFDFSYEEPVSIEKKHEKASYNLLYIGNSFTYYNDIDDITVKLGQSMGIDIQAKRFAIGSQKLSQSASADDQLGALIDADLKAHNDYTDVILQEQSNTPISSYSAFLSGAMKLQKKIVETQKKADIHLYETWSYEGITGVSSKEEGTKVLKEAYRKAGSVMKVNVNYVGDAFATAQTIAPKINLYWSDDKHPSFAGSYLAAATHLAAITGKDVRQATYIGSSDTYFDGVQCLLTKEESTTLLGVAYDTVYGVENPAKPA